MYIRKYISHIPSISTTESVNVSKAISIPLQIWKQNLLKQNLCVDLSSTQKHPPKAKKSKETSRL